jgi:hypothetical protein
MNSSIVLSKKTFNTAVSRMKGYFSNDRKITAEALSQGLYAEDYNVVAKKLKSQPKTSTGVISTLSDDKRMLLNDNLKELVGDIQNLNANKAFFVSNATSMLSGFSLSDLNIKNTSLMAAFNEIQSTMESIKKYNEVTRLSVSGYNEPTRYFSDIDHEYEINASLKTDNFFIEWRSVTIEHSDFEGRNVKDNDHLEFLINGVHYFKWLNSFLLGGEEFDQALTALEDFFHSISRAQDAYLPELTISPELAIMLKNELL